MLDVVKRLISRQQAAGRLKRGGGQRPDPLEDEVLSRVAQPTEEEPDARRMNPLSVEELAPHFPQLEIHGYLGRGGIGIV